MGYAADKLFETSEAGGHLWLFSLFVAKLHAGLNVSGDLVEEPGSESILMSLDEDAMVVSWHAKVIDKINIVRHDNDGSRERMYHNYCRKAKINWSRRVCLSLACRDERAG